MRRSFGIDVLACPRCGGRLRLLALIEQRAVIARILGHLGLPTEVPAARAPRSPPLALAGDRVAHVANAIADPALDSDV